MEEVLQQIVIPSLRPHIVELYEIELACHSKTESIDPIRFCTTLQSTKQIETDLIEGLPKHLKGIMQCNKHTDVDNFSNVIKVLQCIGPEQATFNEMKTTLIKGQSPLEKLNHLPDLVKTILDKVSCCL